jgi:hypothetical protein
MYDIHIFVISCPALMDLSLFAKVVSCVFLLYVIFRFVQSNKCSLVSGPLQWGQELSPLWSSFLRVPTGSHPCRYFVSIARSAHGLVLNTFARLSQSIFLLVLPLACVCG